MRIATSVAASAHHLEDDPLVDGPLPQVVMACFAATADFAARACFVELDDFVELDESAVCLADLAERPGGFRFRDDCLGYILADCLAYRLGDCRLGL